MTYVSPGSTPDPHPPDPQSSSPVHQNPFEDIQVAVVQLAKSVTELTTRQAAQVKRARKLAIIALIGFALDIILTVSGVFLVAKANYNSDNISRQQIEIEQVTETIRTDGICPVYDIILTGYNAQSPNALANPARYENTFKSYEAAATKLGCVHHTRGPQK